MAIEAAETRRVEDLFKFEASSPHSVKPLTGLGISSALRTRQDYRKATPNHTKNLSRPVEGYLMIQYSMACVSSAPSTCAAIGPSYHLSITNSSSSLLR